MDGLEFARIEEAERLELEMDFSKEEVVKVLHEMEGDKAQVRMVSLWLFSKILECSGNRCHGILWLLP